MKTLIKLLGKIEKDKVLHFSCSLILFFLIAGLCNIVGLTNFVIILVSAILTFGIGVAKEIYDKHHTCNFDYKDLIADWCGILVGAGLLFIIYL